MNRFSAPIALKASICERVVDSEGATTVEIYVPIPAISRRKLPGFLLSKRDEPEQ